MFVEKIKNILKSKNILAKDMLSELGINKNQLRIWELAEESGKDPKTFKSVYVSAIADYLGTTTDYLYGNETLSEETEVQEQATFWGNYFELCKKASKSPNSVGKELGCSSGSITEWKKGRVPKWGTLLKIAEYFDVSVAYLLGRQEDPRPAEPKPQLYPLENNRVHMIPLFESASAGFGALAVNHIVDYVPLYFVSSLEAAETICIKVHGDSMYPKIEDGDVIQVHKQDSVDSGSIAVVLLDNEEGLVKKVVYGETWIELHSMNPMYKTTRFNGPDVKRIRVVGLVKKIIKDV